MKTGHIRTLGAAAVVGGLMISSVDAQEKTPGYNQDIPAKIMTPDTVETRLGTLNFVDGVPTAETKQEVYDHLLRLYGPLETWFDKTWRPGEFELVK